MLPVYIVSRLVEAEMTFRGGVAGGAHTTSSTQRHLPPYITRCYSYCNEAGGSYSHHFKQTVLLVPSCTVLSIPIYTDLPTRAGLGPIHSMLLLDRELDLVTPMCTQLTYEGLLDEVMGVNNGFVQVGGTRLHVLCVGV